MNNITERKGFPNEVSEKFNNSVDNMFNDTE